VEVIDFSDIINFDNYDQLLPLVANSIWAGALLALIGGLVGVFVMHRELAFAVHGISELSFAGAAVFLLIGLDVVFGSVFGSFIAAAIIAVLGEKARDRNSIVGVLMPFGLGIGILALAVARGVNSRLLGIAFILLLGLAVAAAVQIVGALLVLALLVTPAAAALRLSNSQVMVPLLSVLFAMIAMVGGTLLALGGTLPISPYVTTISFVIYLVARVIAKVRVKA